MIPDLLWIIGFYVAAAAFAHAVFGRHPEQRPRHYVLVAGNHQLQIEWYVRALQHFSRRTGTDIGITVVLDSSSSDETGPILERFARGASGIRLIRQGENGVQPQVDGDSDAEKLVWVNLEKREDLFRLPL